MNESLLYKEVKDYVEFLISSSFFNGKIHEIVIKESEMAIFLSTMEYCEGNQSYARDVLGISRATLRKKLSTYDMLHSGKTKPNVS